MERSNKERRAKLISQCICDNCAFFNIFDVIVTFDSRGYMKYRKCTLEKKYVRFDWNCQNWKRKTRDRAVQTLKHLKRKKVMGAV